MTPHPHQYSLAVLEEPEDETTPAPIQPPDLLGYDRYVVFFSGGKDSIASALFLLDMGVDASKIELHHHLVDGKESDLFDWPCTDGYCAAVANALGLPIYFSWRDGGLEAEMLKQDACSRPVLFETPSGEVLKAGGGGAPNTRMLYPQQAASIQTRWCSGVAKVDVSRLIFTNDPRFENSATLVITGERAEESANRARYATFGPHDRDLRAPKQKGKNPRLIDHFRPVHAWSETEVWEIIRRWGIVAHPSYHLGFSRCSCMTCIFLTDEDWARLYAIDPARVERHIAYETQFGKTIDRARLGIRSRLEGVPAPSDLDPEWIQAALSRTWDLPARVAPDDWVPPVGAFRKTGGPT